MNLWLMMIGIVISYAETRNLSEGSQLHGT
jgi:hypothetical protein